MKYYCSRCNCNSKTIKCDKCQNICNIHFISKEEKNAWYSVYFQFVGERERQYSRFQQSELVLTRKMEEIGMITLNGSKYVKCMNDPHWSALHKAFVIGV